MLHGRLSAQVHGTDEGATSGGDGSPADRMRAAPCPPPQGCARFAQVCITCYISCYLIGAGVITDIVRELGHLSLGSRLKRLGERLQAQTQVLLAEADISLPASHFPVLAALDRLGPLSVGELAQAVGISQPGISRMLENLQSHGFITSQRSKGDRRLRPIVLTKAGQQLIARAKQVSWPRVEAAVADACAGASGTLLEQLAALEEALAAAPLHVRAARMPARGRRYA
jgi:DNA-binding MarR family transcriptional regulator